jgi:1-deoxy-D-xylulose-5-phosphate reductoisomerase
MTPNVFGNSKRKLVLLGSTGSIGTNTLRVVRNLGEAYQVVGLAARRNTEQLADQAREHDVECVAVCDEAAADRLRRQLKGVTVLGGTDAARQLVESIDADVLVAAVVGAAGLSATLAGIRRGMCIALANKETLVAAGELVMPLVRREKVDLLPIDSEHSAIFQCLQAREEVSVHGSIKRIVLTASGGPFRQATAEQIENATVEQALDHPTWNMGPKITVDSATMMNKALEIIEAHWLFDMAADQIEVIIHPQSIVHSFVEFADHSVLAQLGTPDMQTPIQYALTHPHRTGGCSNPLDWSQLRRLDFEPPDFKRFPALKLAFRVIETGGTSGAVLNAANEAAVSAFLDGRMPFGRIVQLVGEAMDALPPEPADSLQTILEADRRARSFVQEQLGG